MILLRVVVRLVVLVLLLLGSHLVADATATPGDAGAAIGVGLLYFLAVAVVTLTWSVLDARRHGLGRALAVWIAVALSMVVVSPVVTGLWNGDPDWAVVRTDMRQGIAFQLVLVGVPALVGGVVGEAWRRARRAS